MHNTEYTPLETIEKSYSCPQGPFAWLNDIEITKGPYLASFLLLALNLFLVRQPFFTIDIPYMDSMTFALHEVKELSIFGFIALILGAVSIFALLVPIIKFFEWKYIWFIPSSVTGLYGIAAAFYLIAQKNRLMENSLIGYAYDLFSIEINVTTTGWMLMLVNIAILLLSVKMLVDVKKNERTY